MTTGYRTATLEVPFPVRIEPRAGSARKLHALTPVDCDCSVTGTAWTGQIVAQDVATNISLHDPLPDGLKDVWDHKCTWYQLFGSAAELDDLAQSHAATAARREELLRMAPTATVTKELAGTDVRMRQLRDAMAFCELGFLGRRPTYRVDGRDCDPEVPLIEQGCHGPTHMIDVVPSRVGLSGLHVHLTVACAGAKGATLDTFQALVPCSGPAAKGPAPSMAHESMTVADLARSLQNVYCSRFPEWQPAGAAKIKFYGRFLEADRLVGDVFVSHTQAPLFIERATLVIDVEPYVRPLPEEEAIAAEAAASALVTVVSNVGDRLFRIDNPPKPPGPDAKPIRGTPRRATPSSTPRRA